jgi:O-antigen ligase/tetratricopeptide (TPR) repeat protein
MNKYSKYINNIIQYSLLIIPILPLIVTRSLFFPFVTGRNFIFRIVIEILFALWAWLMLSDSEYRPKTSPILYSIICLVGVLFLATIFGISPYKSFWSSFERMEGFWQYWHYFLYFIVLAGTFKESKDWFRLAFVSIGASLIASVYAVFQLLGKLDVHQGDVRLDATMGNATYLAMYLVFHIFLLVYVSIKMSASKIWVRLIPLVLAVFEFFIVYKTATRGALLGFLAGVFIFALVNAILSKGLVRKVSVSALGVVILIPITFFLIKDSSFVQNSETLSRFASISISETTTQSRFIIWKMAFESFKDRPILGWGPESFVYIFSKYYNSELWRQEPWFDRAHNVFLDWLTSTGIVGFIAYFALFGSAIFVLIKSLKSKLIGSKEVGCFLGLMAAYLVSNIFVFDSFNSYFIFFALLAYWHFVYTNSKSENKTESYIFPKNIKAGIAIIVLISTAYTLLFFNLRPILASKSIVGALQVITYAKNGQENSRDLNGGLEILKKGINYNTFGTTEIREQLAQYAGKINNDPATSKEGKKKFVGYALDQMKLQRDTFPYDIRAKAFLSTLYGDYGDYENAILVAKEGLDISRQRQQFWFILAEAYFKAGEESLAIDAMKSAYELAPEYPEAIHNYAMVLIFSGMPEKAEDLLYKHFGTRIYPDAKYVNAYAALGDYEKLAIVWEKLVQTDPNNYEYRLSLAAAYFRTYRDNEAIKELEEVKRLNPNLSNNIETLIKGIQTGEMKR